MHLTEQTHFWQEKHSLELSETEQFPHKVYLPSGRMEGPFISHVWPRNFFSNFIISQCRNKSGYICVSVYTLELVDSHFLKWLGRCGSVMENTQKVEVRIIFWQCVDSSDNKLQLCDRWLYTAAYWCLCLLAGCDFSFNEVLNSWSLSSKDPGLWWGGWVSEILTFTISSSQSRVCTSLESGNITDVHSSRRTGWMDPIDLGDKIWLIVYSSSRIVKRLILQSAHPFYRHLCSPPASPRLLISIFGVITPWAPSTAPMHCCPTQLPR